MTEEILTEVEPADNAADSTLPTDTVLPEEEIPPTADAEADNASEDESGARAPSVDLAALAAADLSEIKRLSPVYAEAESLCELPFAHRFAELRELGLSVREALAAAAPRLSPENGKAHLRPSVGVGRTRPAGTMSAEELAEARALFRDLDERAIHALYRKVTTGR